MRELRRSIGFSQRECAVLLGVSVETFRAWDSGRRSVPVAALHSAKRTVAEHEQQTEQIPLSQLAAELGVHVRTLQAAARTGRLDVQFSGLSGFPKDTWLTQ